MTIENLQRAILCCLRNVQSRANHFVHVVVFVLAEPAAEDYVGASVGLLFVARIERGVLLVVDGIVRLHSLLPLGGILVTDHGFGL